MKMLVNGYKAKNPFQFDEFSKYEHVLFFKSKQKSVTVKIGHA